MTNQRKLQDSEVPSFDTMISHVMTDYALATRLPKVYDSGYYWYNVAQSDAIKAQEELLQIKEFSRKNVIDTIAILSPGINWGINVGDATRVLEAQAYFISTLDRQAYCANNGVSTPYGWANHCKAWGVLDGSITFDLKPTCLKTWNFGQCIEYPDSYLGVCIDQHIAHILLGDGLRNSMKIKPKQYKLFASVLIHCASLLGLLPSRLQAIIWQYRQHTLNFMVD